MAYDLWEHKRRNSKTGGWFDVTESRLGSGYYSISSGIVDVHNNIKFETEDEMLQYRREQVEDWRRQENQIDQNKKEATTAARQNEKISKPRKRPMSKQYTSGDTIVIDNEDYKVSVPIYDNNERLLGYMASDKNNVVWFVDKYGEKITWNRVDFNYDIKKKRK